MPWRIELQLAAVEPVAGDEKQRSGERDADAQRDERSFRTSDIAVFEQKAEAADQADQHADQQDDDYGLEHSGSR